MVCAGWRVPVWTSTVATGPLLLSICASTTTPRANWSGLAFSSATSDTTMMFSNRVVNALTLESGDRHGYHIASPVLDEEIAFGKLSLHTVGGRHRGGPILLDGHDDGHFGRLDVVNGLFGLRHDPVVRSDDEDRNVSYLSAAGGA